MNLTNQKDNGYIALSFTLILGALLLLIFTTTFLLSVGSLERTTDHECFSISHSWANSCVEEALNKIRKDPDDSLDISYNKDGEGCEITNVERSEDEVHFISRGNCEEYVRIIEIEAEIIEEDGERTVQVIKWE